MAQAGFNNTSVGLSNTDFSSFGVIVPDTLKFSTAKSGLAARRIPIKIRTQQQTYASNNNKLIRFELPNATLYDPRSGYLSFNIALAKTGGTYIRIARGVFSLFNRIRILAGATEIEDIRDYNRIQNILWKMMNPVQTVDNIATPVMGFGTQTQRNADGASGSTAYIMPLMSAFFTQQLLPLDNVNSAIVLEMYLEDPTACLETDGTSPIITFSNGVFHMERLELQQSYRDFIANYVKSNGLKLGFHTWERYINPLVGGATQNIVIQHRSSSMNVMLNLYVNSVTINDPTVNDKFITWPGTTSNLSSNQVIVNNMPFPDEPTDYTYSNMFEGYQQYCRWIIKWKLTGMLEVPPPIAIADYPVDSFIQVDDFEAYPELEDVINPFSTLSNNTSIIKKQNYNGGVPANTQLDTWVEYFKQFQILPSGLIKILQ